MDSTSKLIRNPTLKVDSLSTSSNKKTKAQIRGKESWRDLTITKICDICGKEYHPPRSGFQYTSRFCSWECSKKRNNRLSF